MKNILIAFVLLFSLGAASDSVNELNNNPITPVDGKCATSLYDGAEVVSPRDFSICPDDIAYNVLNMIFNKVFNEVEIFSSFFDDGLAASSSARAYDIGGPIISLLEAVTWLTVTSSVMVISYISIKSLYLSASSGKFLGDWSSTQVLGRTLFAIMLIYPVGSFSLAQIFILIIAMFSIMGGNYIWGAFLSMQNSSQLAFPEDTGYKEFETYAVSQSESMISANVCSMRNSSVRMELSQSNYEDSWYSDVDAGEHLGRLAACSRNGSYIIVSEEDGTFTPFPIKFPYKSLKLGSPNICKSTYDYSNKHNFEFIGGEYACGELSFSSPDLELFFESSEILSANDSDISGYIESELDSFTGSYDRDYVDITGKISSSDSFSDADRDIAVRAMKDRFKESLDRVYKSTYSLIGSEGKFSSQSFDAMAIVAQGVFGNYMGGAYNGSEVRSFTDQMKAVNPYLYVGMVAGSLTGMNDGTTQKSVLLTGVQESNAILMGSLFSDAKLASFYAMSSHCALNWRDYRSSYKVTSEHLGEAASDHREDYSDLDGSLKSECFIPLQRGKELDAAILGTMHDKQIYKVDNDSVIALSLSSSYRDYLTLTKIDDMGLSAEEKDEKLTEVINKISSESLSESMKINNKMSEYFLIIRAAMQKAVYEVVTENQPKNNKFLDMRNLGLASAGGFILSMSGSGNNFTKYKESIASSVAWSDSASNSYYHSKAAQSDDKYFDLNYKRIATTTNMLFSTVNVSDSDVGIASADREALIGDISSILGNILLYPMEHLKVVGGFDKNLTLRDGAEKCSKSRGCSISSVHPVVALIRMGNDIIELSIYIVIAKSVTGGILYLMATQKGGAGGSMSGFSKSLLSKFPLVKFINLAVEIVDFVLGFVLKFIISPLFVVAIFFSFILPLSPYLAFLVAFIGWIVLIFELLVIVNVWCLLGASVDQNGGSRANIRDIVGYLAQLLMTPSLMVIGLILGWYLASISVYILNITIFSALSPTETNTLFGLLDTMMFYTVYLVMIFVAVKHSFKVIELMPDKIFGLFSISGSGNATSDTLGFESVMQAAAGHQMMSTMASVPNGIAQKKDQLKNEIKQNKSYEQQMMASEQRQMKNQEELSRKYDAERNGPSGGSPPPPETPNP